MSNFGAKISEILERRKLRASELARLSGLTEALISRWVNGQQTFVSHQDLAALVAAISDIQKERAEIIRAHLLDEIHGPGCELIDVRIRGAGSTPREESARVALPLKIQRALEILGKEAVGDADVRQVLLGLANLIAPETKDE